MLEEPQDRLTDLAAAIADGRVMDWDAIESGTHDQAERVLVRRLRAIAEIGRVHADITFHGPFTLSESFGSAIDGTSVHEGLTWGSLRIREKVGRGRFGDVYRAWDPSLDREVALKLLRRREEDEAADDRLVIEEGRLMARVRHPNVVTIYGAQRIDGRTGLWMEFIDGRTLEAELRERGPFSSEELVTLGVELCRALSAVHDAGLIHRDVKAQNVLRDSQGHVLLGDFGTGRELDESESDQYEIAGTPAYLAPEIFRRARATPQSDLYSLGALLFHVATGEYPVQGRSLRELRHAHEQGVRSSVHTLRPDLPRPLADVIDRALAPEPQKRFASAAAMEAALSIVATPQVADVGEAREGPRRWLVSTTVTIGLAAVVLWLGVTSDFEFGFAQAGSGRRSTSSLQADSSDPRRVLRQISPDPNLAGPGVPSPDGRLLSYVEQGELTLFEIAARRRWRLTGTDLSGDPPGWVLHSRFSFDGSRLTYLRFSTEQNPPRPEIRTVPVGGGRSRRVWRAEDAREIWLQHSAGDDDLILAARERPGGESEFLVISTENGSAHTTVAIPTIGLTSASLSPDGRLIAYERPDPATGLRDIHVMGVDDGVDQPLIRDASTDQSPVWTRDGRHLLFVSDRSGTAALWAQGMDGAQLRGRPMLIEPNLGWAYPMGGLTNAGALFFRRRMGTRDVYVVDIDPLTLALTGEPQRVSQDGVGTNGSSAWSPDGKQIAFFRRHEDDRWRLVVKSFVDGKEQEFWRPHLEGIIWPRWESNRTLLFKAAIEGRSGLHRLDLDTGDIATVLERSFNEYELLPEPGVIVYSVRSSREVIRRDLVTGQETVIHHVPPPSTLVAMDVSHRGDRLAYSAPLGGGKGWALRIVDFTSPQQAREIFRVGPDEFIGAYAWSLDDREVIIKRARNAANPEPDARRESDESRLWAVDAKTGQSRLIGLNFDGLQQLRMSPDGRRLSFDGGWPLQEVWALEHAVAGLDQ